jgi:uncharacterized protein DUF4157
MKQSLPIESERQYTRHSHHTANNVSPVNQAFVDNRESTAIQRQLMAKMANSPQAIAQRMLSEQMHNSSRMSAQRKQMAKASGGFVQRVEGEEELLQGKFTPVQRKEEDELPLQGKFSAAQLAQAPEEKQNNTGLPDNLKQGVENLSGMSLDNVKVHYNSSKPAQLNALAYAQGTDIHLGAGQEKHLPHEAWHVVQQAQGRVQPTMQMKDGVPVNDDQALEHEADVMGAKALGSTVQRQGAEEEELQGKFETVQRQGPEEEELLQGKFERIQTNRSAPHGVAQLFAAYYAWGSANTTPHVHVYNGGMHLKTAGGTRYNIIKNGSKHAQASDALLNVQGKGNKKLRQTIKHTARDTFGIEL